MQGSKHILINGLSMGSGGGFTVGKELFLHLAQTRDDWKFILAIIGGHRLHEEISNESLPPNCEVFRAPSDTLHRVRRMSYERRGLVEWAASNGITHTLQLNGMVIPTMQLPTLSHNQDPWPYRPQAYTSWKDHLTAFFKRREHKRALKQADCMGFTSRYLRDLVTNELHVTPKRAGIFYNGLSESWLDRAREPLPEWKSRSMELLSVSNVHPYKRQYLVVQALPELVKQPQFHDLVYRIVGHCEPIFREQLLSLAKSLGVEKHVVIHGRVSDEGAEKYMSQARAFVLMSVCESFGIPAIEAMTFGTPVVVSDCCAMPEVCGDAAILSPVDDVAELSKNLAIALTDESRVNGLRERGALNVQRFKWNETAEAIALAFEAM